MPSCTQIIFLGYLRELSQLDQAFSRQLLEDDKLDMGQLDALVRWEGKFALVHKCDLKCEYWVCDSLWWMLAIGVAKPVWQGGLHYEHGCRD